MTPPMPSNQQPEPSAMDRYTLGDAIRLAYLHCGENAWCSVADAVMPFVEAHVAQQTATARAAGLRKAILIIEESLRVTPAASRAESAHPNADQHERKGII